MAIESPANQACRSGYTSIVRLEHEFPLHVHRLTESFAPDQPMPRSSSTASTSSLPPLVRAAEDIKILKAFFRQHHAVTLTNHETITLLEAQMRYYQAIVDDLCVRQNRRDEHNLAVTNHMIRLMQSMERVLDILRPTTKQVPEPERIFDHHERTLNSMDASETLPPLTGKRRRDNESGRKVTGYIHNEEEKGGYSAGEESEANTTSYKGVSAHRQEWKQKHAKRRKLCPRRDSGVGFE